MKITDRMNILAVADSISMERRKAKRTAEEVRGCVEMRLSEYLR